MNDLAEAPRTDAAFAPALAGPPQAIVKGFAPGTRLLSLRGWTKVADLVVGDRLITTRHMRRSVRRCIRSGLDTEGSIRITAGAFAPDLPRCDVVLAPDHAVFIEDALVPARALVNGATILHDPAAGLRYHLLELASDDMVLADGLPVESGQPGGAPAGNPCAALAHPCIVRAARRHLLRRADLLGHGMTQDPDLHLRADGRRLWGQVANGIWSGWIPARTQALHIVSRSAAPSDTDAVNDDTRRLGVALQRIVLRTDTVSRVLAADVTPWGDGFHDMQTDGRARWRWTNGDARLDPALWTDIGTPFRVDLHVLRTQTYRRPELLHSPLAAYA